MTRIVCNASPLIVLAKAGMLELLPEMFTEIFIPRAVVSEIEAGPDDDPMKRQLGSPWLHRVELDQPLSPLATWQIGPGESEVIEYARTRNGVAVLLDDKVARRASISLNLRTFGTLSILACSAKAGRIPSFRMAADALIEAGLYLDSALIDEIEHELNL